MHVYSVQLKIPADPTDLFQVDHAAQKAEFEQPPGIANALRDNRCGARALRRPRRSSCYTRCSAVVTPTAW
eukprot:COSAG06_NODE_81_length_25302_cov_21.168902_16_plen_71_part_00